MRIAISAAGEGLDAPLDARFGRAPRILILDDRTGALEALDNRDAAAATQGAGIRAAERVIAAGAARLLTGHCGPHAFRALRAAGVEVYTAGEGTVADALAAYREGRLHRAEGPDAGGRHP